ncbi:MAG: TonB-dependent receptor [Acidobacteria bacterium]|nr:TonB-dependent receptor [Acidobacteriota bacterium]
MRGKGAAAVVLAGLALVALLPDRVNAQSVIAGVVKDTTGAVLPGVTVEASSPALIEKVRAVVTNEAGQYRIVDLRPGVYTVVFALTGFNAFKREGIELPANFAATINAELRVGAIEESVTVSGESPVVDVQSAQRQQVMTRELLESVPSGRSLWAWGQTIPSVTMAAPDVGGSRGTQYVAMATHGSYHSDNAHTIDGMNMKSLEADGQWTMYHDTMMFEEIAYETTGSNAELSGAGVGLKLIPREGGNTFSGQVFLSYLPGAWGSDNVTPELKARGLQAGARIHRTFDYNASVGGPIQRDRLWFFGSYRHWGSDTFVNNAFYNLDPTRRTYQPDFSRQVIDDNLLKSAMTRLTWRMSQRHKFGAYFDHIDKFRGHECTSLFAEEACGVRYPKSYWTAQAKYTGTLTNRLLAEGGLAINNWTWSNNERVPGVNPTDIPRFDRTLGTRWSARHLPARYWSAPRFVLMGSVSYATGSHAVKTGISWDWGTSENWLWLGETGVVDLVQEYLNGVPASVQVYNTPLFLSNRLNYDLAAYVQDSWRINRLTLSPGVRVEWINAEIRPQASGAGRFVPAREFAREKNMPNWGPDVSPRFAVAYDLFGDAKTALKASVGKYMRSTALGFASTYNPMRSASDRRTWTDRNGDDIAQDNEIGSVNRPFDVIGVRTRNPDPDIKRPYQWEFSAGIQREIVPRVSVSASWVRRTWRRLIWTENLLVSHDDYTPIPIQNPIDPSETIRVFSLDRAKLALVKDLDRNSKKNRRWNNGFDFDIKTRVGGGNVYAGLSLDRQIRVQCEVADPNELRFCDQSKFGMPYRTMFKVAGTYPLIYGIDVSGSLQSYAGGSNRLDDAVPWDQVSYNVTRSVLPTLTQSSVTVPLIQPGTKYLPRWNMADLRVGKRVDVGKVKLRPQFDIYNATNSNSILDMGQTFGPALDRVNEILPGRAFAFSVRVDF